MRHQSPVERFLPEGPLAAVVERFWTISWDLRGKPTRTGETLPHPSVYLVVEAGRSGLAGVNTGRFQRLLEGKGRVYGVKFHPGCFRPFWPGPVRTITDRILPLESAFGPEGAELEGAVLRCGDDVGAAVALLEAFLLKRLPPPDPRAQLARQVVARILEDRNLIQAEAVAREVGMSLRSLQRLFLDYVGVNPKWVIERYRLHEAMERLEKDPSLDLPGLALALGYYDQAHFIRAFKRLLGRTPGGYAKASEG
ncbi:helix-turn-helix domain-containing protein [Geothrix sp. PMB-07]|uniref:AraC family transcriptional regulator n=1 Tax=Geothrix sp. PMB-07 TaxID=3068640 RepID=UPI002741A6F5|nr:helix-turn-helix domain-containing protein [Geothrix sp. PMB-07]WLT30267.1 helix-turn-helix domain-containing protein [Geothrix sp. PMB-07]